VVDFAIFFIFAKLCGYNYLLVNTLSFSVATSLNYYLCVRFVFESGSYFRKKTEIFLLFCVSGISLAINLFLLFIFIGIFDIDLMISKAIAVLLTFLFNYFGRSNFVFKNEQAKTRQ
jgi:putative flippase GtrA